jgi:hypothetical protein
MGAKSAACKPKVRLLLLSTIKIGFRLSDAFLLRHVVLEDRREHERTQHHESVLVLGFRV